MKNPPHKFIKLCMKKRKSAKTLKNHRIFYR